MIDFDVKIDDKDGAVLTGNVRIEIRNDSNKLVALEEIETNQEFVRKTYENLEENKTYKIIFYAPQYNEGNTDNTYKADYIIKQIEIYTEPGIEGSLILEKIGRTGTGKNLIDVSSKVNWYVNHFQGTFNEWGIEYDEQNEIVTLGISGKESINFIYDFTSYIGKEVTISFKARRVSETNNSHVYIMNDNKIIAAITDLTTDWKEYTYTLIVGNNGYVGFKLGNGTTKVEFQNLQVELGNKKTDYEEFRYVLNTNININLIDTRDEITTNDYYVRIYKNGEQLEEIRYEEIGEDNIVENARKSYEVEESAEYRIELLVKINDRYYTLESQDVKIEAGEELKGISNIADYLKIQPYGNYIILKDLDFSGRNMRFGAKFEGDLDFNGHTITRGVKEVSIPTLFYSIGENGVIENIVLNVKLNNDKARSMDGILAYSNNGTIRNVQLNVIESTAVENEWFRYLCVFNRYTGLIENFIINLAVPVYGSYGISAMGQNEGVIRNGYIYGENIKAIFSKPTGVARDSSPFIVKNTRNGRISNIYSLSNVDVQDVTTNETNSNLIIYNESNAQVNNVYSVGVGQNTTDYSKGPNVYKASSTKIYDSYYFADEIFTNKYNIKGNKLSLWDVEFQKQLLNSSNAFEVDSLVKQGYYPQLKMPDVMPRQEYITLPEVTDADLPDILSTKVLEQGSNKVKVEMSVNNPAAEQIKNIKIENMTVNIISQEYKDGKSKVIVELTNPIVCVSKYNVLSITTKGAFSIDYVRSYQQGERVIYVDLYREIWNINDWKNIAKSNTENYMLMADLNFINEGNTICLSTVNGIIDGNNHTISNINLTNKNGLIYVLYGKIKNLKIKQANLITNSQGNYKEGIIYYGESSTVIDNVHVEDMTITRLGENTEYIVGGIISKATHSIIRNSSVTNLTIKDEENYNVDSQSIGGIVGSSSYLMIENCYVQNLEMDIKSAITTRVGGIVGIEDSYGNIQNCYAQGNIIAEGENVGGIAGFINGCSMQNCYSMVNISSQSQNIGGIAGSVLGSQNEITNNLSIGNLYTKFGKDGLNRIIGNYQDSDINNYAYEKQKINGYIDEEKLGATLLSKKGIFNLSLGNSYSYEGKEKSILPKLYNTEGTELLPNQQDHTLEEIVNLEIESVEAEKPNTTEAQISIAINNPQETQITEIQIEDMECTITRNVTQNGKTNIVVRAIPKRYYDSYKITKIIYDEENEQKEKNVEVLINIQFYKELYTYEDWQTIEIGTYQNYRLMSDIDFAGKDNIKTNVTINRLEAENKIYTLKNINLNLNSANTGFINNIVKSMKNIGFENVTIQNSAKGNYCGIIVTNKGEIENLNFSNITIEAQEMGYVGMIGYGVSGDIKGVTLDTIQVTGATYIGGLTGRHNCGLSNVRAKNITIVASGKFAGGIIGYTSSSGNTNSSIYPDHINIELTDSNITGADNVGGITGYNYYPRLTDSSVKNTKVIGKSNVGGMTGQKNVNASFYCYNNIVDGCEIYGSASNIGGLTGNSTSYERNAIVKNSKIIGTSVDCKHVGGLYGYQYYNIWYNVVDNCEVISKGESVGGISGYVGMNSRHAPNNSYVIKTKVEGRSRVGGIIGTIRDGPLTGCIVKAEVKATAHSAGGLIGYMENTEMTTITYKISMYNNGVAGSTITAPAKVGGLVGDIAKDLNTKEKFFYNNYAHAYLICDDANSVSMGIGGSKSNNDVIQNTYVYQYSEINGEYINEDIDTYQESQYVSVADLELEETYKNKFGWKTSFEYDSLKNNKYPMPLKITGQEGIDLPQEPEIANISNFDLDDEENNDEQVIELPNITVYPISAYEFNIDFSTIPEDTYFTYSIDGKEIGTKKIENRTYTFTYNYQDEIEIKLNHDNGQEEIITITPSDVVSHISLVGDTYTYLDEYTIYQGDNSLEGEYVNIYKGKALSKEGYVYDIQMQTMEELGKVETKLEETAKPQNQYTYNGNQIDVYGIYSTINGNVKSQIYIVKNGRLSAVANNLDWKIGNIITDNYNGKEYQTVLSALGKLIDIKEKLKYPENFLNENIDQIVSNETTGRTEAMVHYNTGKVVVFNYATGKIIYENNVESNISLFSFVINRFQNVWSDYEDRQEKYAESQELMKKLEETPIEKALIESEIVKTENLTGEDQINGIENNTLLQETSNTSKDNTGYIIVYNQETQNYEVYSESEIIESTEEEPISETIKIEKNGLQNFYSYNTIKGNDNHANGIVMISTTIIIVFILLICLRAYIRSKKVRKRYHKQRGKSS